MDDWVRVFAGDPLAARSLAEAFAREGVAVLEREAEDGQGPASGQRPQQAELHVPPQERERAERILGQWSTHQTLRVEGVSRRLAGVFALSLLVPAALWAAALALPERVARPSLEATGVAWLVGFVAFAQLEQRRHRGERITLPPRS